MAIPAIIALINVFIVEYSLFFFKTFALAAKRLFYDQTYYSIRKGVYKDNFLIDIIYQSWGPDGFMDKRNRHKRRPAPSGADQYVPVSIKCP